jgi:hypothetical protein
MNAPRTAPSSAELATEVNGLLTGLGILTMALFPFALPGLLLALPLALLAAPFALGAVAVLLGAGVVAAPLWLACVVMRSRSHRGRAGSPGTRPARR